MNSESGADKARRTKARSKSSFRGLAPSLVRMLSLFVLVVIMFLEMCYYNMPRKSIMHLVLSCHSYHVGPCGPGPLVRE